MPKESKSPSVNIEEEMKKAAEALDLNDDQKARLGVNMDRMMRAKEQRDQRREEFDDMDYETDYFYNKRAANAYLPAKRNDDEVRINSGTIEKKIEVVSNELMAINLQPDGQVFDKNDNEIKQLGRDFIDIVRRTNQIERDDDFWEILIREFLTQRAAFFEEVDEYVTTTNRGRSSMKDGKTSNRKKGKKFTAHRARKKILSGLQVYLGDIYIPAYRFQEQPYVIKYVRRSWEEANSIYKNWSRWKFVKKGGAHSSDKPFGYRMNSVEEHEVEEVHIMDGINDEYDIIINGVPMMEESTPLPWEVTTDRRYNITMIALKVMDTDFAYGKPLTASSKTLQSLNDENIRLMIRKFRQAIEPPLANSGKEIFSRDIFSPGSITQGVKAKDLEKLIDHNGVTQSEFNIFQLIDQKAAEFVGVSSQAQGISESGEQTATEIKQLQVNQAKNLGHSVAALIRAKREATYQRLYNILENFTSPTGRSLNALENKIQDTYEKFTITDGIFENGQQGKKIVQFMDRATTNEEDERIFEFEKEEERLGRPTRIIPINVKQLRSIPLFWYVTVNPKPKEGSDLSKVLFKDLATQAQAVSQLSGKPLNGDKLVEEFEFRWDVKDIFQKSAPPAGPGQSPEAQDLEDQIGELERTEMGSQLTEGTRAPLQRPSLNNLAEGAV